MSKAYPDKQTSNMTLDRAILTDSQFAKFYDNNKNLFKIARRLEGKTKKQRRPPGRRNSF